MDVGSDQVQQVAEQLRDREAFAHAHDVDRGGGGEVVDSAFPVVVVDAGERAREVLLFVVEDGAHQRLGR